MEKRQEGGFGFITGTWPFEQSKPFLVFIHGAGSSSLIWEAQVKGLSDLINPVAIDLPGHGASHGEGKNTISGYAQIVVDFINFFGILNPVLCGLSMGGAIVQNLLIHNSNRFPAGILINTGARLKVLPMIFETIEKDFNGYIEMSSSFAVSKENDSSKIRNRIRESVQCLPTVALGDFRACDGFDVMGQHKNINVPVLVITASDDSLTPSKYGVYLAEQIKESQIVHIENAGHLSPMEKPREVNNAIRGFLTQFVKNSGKICLK